jgi:hypothetical protein
MILSLTLANAGDPRGGKPTIAVPRSAKAGIALARLPKKAFIRLQKNKGLV